MFSLPSICVVVLNYTAMDLLVHPKYNSDCQNSVAKVSISYDHVIR